MMNYDKKMSDFVSRFCTDILLKNGLKHNVKGTHRASILNMRGKGKLRESVGDGLNQSLHLPVLDWSGLMVQT